MKKSKLLTKFLILFIVILCVVGLSICMINLDREQKAKITNEILSGSQLGEENLEQGFSEGPEEMPAGASRSSEGITLGPKQESIIYLSQIDNRWKEHPYTSTGNYSQTIGSSGCGPTCAAMVVSGIKGLIYPDVMGDLYVDCGYRSANDGTYFSAFQFTADYFGMDFERVWDVRTSLDKVKNNNYVVVSCGEGLFTTGGHFIVIWKYDDTNNNGLIDDPDILHIYDPYLYDGKFDWGIRLGRVTLSGNDALVTVYNFINYANSGAWFCYPHNNAPEPAPDPGPTPTPVPPTPVETKTGTVHVNTSLNVRSGPGTQYSYIRSLYNGDTVTIYETSGNWYRIGNGEWACADYITVNDTPTPTPVPSTVGQTRKFYEYTYMYSNPDLTGTVYEYLAGTTVEILQNVSSTVDYVYVYATGRKAYVSTSAYAGSTPSIPDTVGQTRRFSTTYTYIYSNSDLTGTIYDYLANTSVEILRNVSASVDYIYVYATGREGYVSTSVYR